MEKSKLTIWICLKTVITCFVIPFILIALYLNGLILYTTLKICLVAFILLFGVAPVIFKFCWPLQRSLLFFNFVNSRDVEFGKPYKYELPGSRNLYVKTDEDILLGTWQILPDNLIEESEGKDDKYFDQALKNGQPVLLYMHGNSGNRAGGHRIIMYQSMRKLFHIFAFDYRSYGDSSDNEPTEVGLVSDAKYMVEWVRNKTTGPMFVWGHSLGTGVSTHALDLLAAEKGLEMNGLILESPFNNLHDEIVEHPFAKPFKELPWFDYLIPNAMYDNGLQFESDKHVKKFNAPILILHAEDDGVVPYHLGYKLFTTAIQERNKSQGAVEFHGFEAKHNYGHKWIAKAPETFQLVSKFVDKYKNDNETKHKV